ncbi:hypothetical protein GCM10027346_13200 [Hymenobacter seoulensis]
MADTPNSTDNTPTTPASGTNPPAASAAGTPAQNKATAQPGEPENQELTLPEWQAPANTVGQQPFAHDPNHYQNEVAGASRGEFGRQSDLGTTQGGYGNELSRGNATYAGSLDTPAATTGYIGEREQRPGGFPDAGNGSFGTQPVGAAMPASSAVGPEFANDNAAPKGPDSGYADSYGTSSLGGGTTAGAQPNSTHRNQQEDYLPNRPEGGPQGQQTGVAPSNSSQGTQEADATPTSGSRSGYDAAPGTSAQGSEESGFGTKGGSYNDEYDSATPNDTADGSPSRGDYNRQDAAQNYGGASDDRTGKDKGADYGPMPGRTSTPD